MSSMPTRTCSFTGGATAIPTVESLKRPGVSSSRTEALRSASSYSITTAATTPCIDCGWTDALARSMRAMRFWDNSARKFYVPAGFENKGEEPFRPSGRFYRITENGLMSIPRIGAGPNTIHFKVADASTIRAPIRVVYRYQTSSGERSHEQLLQPKEFHHNVATYRLDAPGLLRCNSLLIRY